MALNLEKRHRIILQSAKQESAIGMRVACSNRLFWKLFSAAGTETDRRQRERKLLWAEGMTLVPFTRVWGYWKLLVYIPAIRFPNDPSKYGFSYDCNRIHLFAQLDSLLYITVWTAISPRGNIFDFTRYRKMSAGNALPAILVLIRSVCVEEFWPAIAILRFTEGI